MKHNKGFTVIELLISMSLFLVLVGIATGGFLTALRSQRAITSLIEANDSVSLTMEQMTREIRNSRDFGISDSNSRLTFINQYGQSINYFFDGNAIERNGQKITADNVNITKFNIVLSGTTYSEVRQPRITIALSVGIKNKYLELSIPIQTTISPRMIPTLDYKIGSIIGD